MSIKFIFDCFEQWWTEVSKTVKDAVVYLDDSAAECLHWHGSLKRMLDGGAVGVKNFSPFEKADSNQRKAVFVITSPLMGEALRTLMVIIRACSFKHCTVITSLPTRCHTEDVSENDQSFLSLENRISMWMGNVNFIAQVWHIPVFAANVTQDLFIMPSLFRSLSIFECGLLELTTKRTAESCMKSLSLQMQTSIKSLVHSLNSLLDSLQVKSDIFSLGPLSHIVGLELENLSHSQKRKQGLSDKASVVIIDRTLDLAGPLSQTSETIFDQLVRTLPHLQGHVFDVSITMNELASCKSNTVFGRPLLAPGCLAHRNSAAEISALDSILNKRPREALIDINRKVVEIAVRDGISIDPSSRLTSDVLKERVLSYKAKPNSMLKNLGLLQQAFGVVQALSHPSNNCMDGLLATEKALIQYLTSSGEEVLKHIMQMIAEKEHMNYRMEEILIFVAFIYELSGYVHFDNESAIQASIMEAFFQDDDEMKELVSKFVDEDPDEESILSGVRTFFDVLKRLGTIRKGMKKYSTLFRSSNPAFPATYDPLLKQVLEDIFDPTVTETPDIQFHSAGLRDYIKSGFSLFMNVVRPQPRDNPLVLLIILGGITPAEIKLVREISSKQKRNQIIVGCTGVLTPSDVLQDLGLIVKELSFEDDEDL